MADANHKFLSLVAGVQKLIAPIITSAGAADGGKMVKTDPATGKLDPSVMPSGLGADQSILPASEDLTNGPVNIWNDGGTVKVRKANASDASKPVSGFVNAAVTSGNNATVLHDGTISGLTGLTPGAECFLSTTGGQVTHTAPSTAGQVIQSVGRAKSETEVVYEEHRPTVIDS